MHGYSIYNCYIYFIQGHIKDECQMVTVSCPNEGCNEVFIKSQFDDHVQNCQYTHW